MELLRVILVWGVIPIVIALYFYKSRANKHEAMIKLIESGGDINPELLESFMGRRKTYKDDFRRGIIWLAIGFPSVVGALLTAEDDSVAAAAFLSIFIFVGLGYLLSGKLRLRE